MSELEVIAMLLKLGQKIGMDLVSMARDVEPRLRETPIPAEDDAMDAARDALAKELGRG